MFWRMGDYRQKKRGEASLQMLYNGINMKNVVNHDKKHCGKHKGC